MINGCVPMPSADGNILDQADQHTALPCQDSDPGLMGRLCIMLLSRTGDANFPVHNKLFVVCADLIFQLYFTHNLWRKNAPSWWASVMQALNM